MKTNLLIAGTMLITTLCAQAQTETEPNNHILQANTITLNQTMNGALDASSDNIDWYVINLTQAGVLTINVTKSTSYDLIGYIRHTSDTVGNITSFVTSSPSDAAASMSYPLLQGTYYIGLYAPSYPSSGTYSFTAALTLPNFNADTEPNNTVSTAASLTTLPITKTGILGYYVKAGVLDVFDWYKVTLTQPGVLKVKVRKDPTFDMIGVIRHTSDTLGNITSFVTNAVADTAAFMSYPLLQGTYYIGLNAPSYQQFGAYSFTVSLALPYYPADVEPNNFTASAATLSLNANHTTGILGYYVKSSVTDGIDWYRLSIPANDTLKFTAEIHEYFGLIIRLFSASDSSAVLTGYANYPGDTIFHLSYPVSAGNYLIQMSTGGGFGTYKLTYYLASNPSMAVQEINQASLPAIYPNPSNGTFTISFDQPELVSGSQMLKQVQHDIAIYNILGENIYQSKIKNLKSEIGLSEQPNGIYFVKIKTEKESYSQQIIINK